MNKNSLQVVKNLQHVSMKVFYAYVNNKHLHILEVNAVWVASKKLWKTTNKGQRESHFHTPYVFHRHYQKSRQAAATTLVKEAGLWDRTAEALAYCKEFLKRGPNARL